ncbi:MAG: type II/IV secretion system protein [Opitutaceae bacterium]|nr:type II/IV secretion system protein [Opitutaceae bacterium]
MPSSPANKAFLQALRALPYFDFEREAAALASRHGHGTLDFLEALITEKLLPKDEACRLWATAIGHAYVDVLASVITEEAVEKIPQAIAQKVKAIGLYLIDGTLTVAMARPDDEEMVRRLRQIVQVPVSPVFGLPCEIENAIAIQYSTEQTLAEILGEAERSGPSLGGSPEGMDAFAESESLVRVLDTLIHFALRERATDIHVEPAETQSRVRFRVDGNLREVLTFSRKLHRALISRLKIISDLNIAEHRFPQDGRFSLAIGTSKAHFRLSCIPSIHGEKAVIRILASSDKRSMLTLDGMLISQSILQPFRRLVQNPNGILFVTGPTGSGKTTTLYAALHELNDPKLNITTIEDPVEIQLGGVTQSQINPHIDLKFPTMLRALLRQDPDVILIGEIRDLETAKVATEAALTGHLVLATLHTNTAPQAIVRLVEIGVAPYMVAPSVIGVLAQRLAARICEKCKEAYTPSRDVLLRYFQEEGLTDVPFYRGRGCPHCRGTGYHGRVAFHELVLVTDEMRQLISEGRSAQEITRAAARVGYRPLRYDGLKKVLLGLTTIEEIEQNTSFEWAS